MEIPQTIDAVTLIGASVSGIVMGLILLGRIVNSFSIMQPRQNLALTPEMITQVALAAERITDVRDRLDRLEREMNDHFRTLAERIDRLEWKKNGA